MKRFFFILACLSTGFASAQTLTLTMDNVPESIFCGETWTDQGLNLRLDTTTASDCYAGSCFFGVEGEDFWLYPSRLTIDISSLENLEMVEVDINDNCGAECTRAFLLEGAGMNVDSAYNAATGSETLTVVNPMNESLTEFAVSSCEGIVQEIRFYQGTSSAFDVISTSKRLIRTVDVYGRPVSRTSNQIVIDLYDDGSVVKRFVANHDSQ